MRRDVAKFAVFSTAALLWSALAANGQEIRGRPLPSPAYAGGSVARVPGSINGMNGSAGSSNTYTGIGVPTGASAISPNARANPAVRNDRMTR